MLRKTLVPILAALLVTLAASSEVFAWGAYHAGYTHVGPNGAYHVSETAVGGTRNNQLYAGTTRTGQAVYGGAANPSAAVYGGRAYVGTNYTGAAVGGYHYSAGYSGATYGGGVRAGYVGYER